MWILTAVSDRKTEENQTGLDKSVFLSVLMQQQVKSFQVSCNEKETNYWKTAEQMNGRLAMMGFFAAVINYGITGWIIPGIV